MIDTLCDIHLLKRYLMIHDILLGQIGLWHSFQTSIIHSRDSIGWKSEGNILQPKETHLIGKNCSAENGKQQEK
jgi:hypothetical protein